jgi:hypothetical protein
VGRLEDEHLAVLALEGRNAEPHHRVSEQLVAEQSGQNSLERVAFIVVVHVVPLGPPPTAHAADWRARRSGEYLRTSSTVDLGDLRRSQAGSETQCDDASGRRSGDQIEITGDRSTAEVTPLQFGENSCREHSLNAAPIKR